MNNVTPEKKEGLLKTLAIIGLFGIIIFIAWLSIQMVAIFPKAVTSLASLADSVYSYDPKAPKTVELKPTTGPVTTGKAFTIAWERPLQTGAYAFTYECEEGLSIEVKTTESEFKHAECGSSYNLGAVDSAHIIINSEKKPVVDVLYTISYFKNNSASSTASKSDSITVLNPRFAINSSTAPTSEVTVNDVVITIEKPVVETPIVEEVPDEEPEVVAPVKVTPKPVYEYTYALPTSDPKGFTDLAITYSGIGRTTNYGSFINTGILNKDEAGAIQFIVKNIGTKTSTDWYFTAKLPGDVTYESSKQLSLKPNERAVLTINFPAVDNTKLQNFSIATKTTNDTNTKNNNLTWSVVVIE
jgi:hypothetical protein